MTMREEIDACVATSKKWPRGVILCGDHVAYNVGEQSPMWVLRLAKANAPRLADVLHMLQDERRVLAEMFITVLERELEAEDAAENEEAESELCLR